MRDVAIDELEVGMRLASPVHRADGGLLVDAGVEVTRTLLRALTMARIKRVKVLEGDADLAALHDDQEANERVAERQAQLAASSDDEIERRFLEQQLEDLRERLAELYAPHNDNPMMMALHDAALEYLAKRLFLNAEESA